MYATLRFVALVLAASAVAALLPGPAWLDVLAVDLAALLALAIDIRIAPRPASLQATWDVPGVVALDRPGRGTLRLHNPTGRRLKVAVAWTLDLILPPELVQLEVQSSTGIAREHFEPGQEVFQQGDVGDRVYVVLAGAAEVVRDGQRVAHGQRPFREAIGERHSVDELEHQRGDAIHVLETVDRADVGVIERREHARFTFEACEALRLADEEARKDLDRDVASQFGVACAVDLAHAARAQQRIDAIGAELSPDQRHTVNVCHQPRGGGGRRCIEKILG